MMKKYQMFLTTLLAFPAIIACLVLFLLPTNLIAEGESEHPAMQTLDAYIEAFNKRDERALRKTHVFPYFFIDPKGNLTVFPEDETQKLISDSHITPSGDWHNVSWISREVIQQSDDKVNIATTFSFSDKDGQAIKSNDAIHILVKENEEWRINGLSVCEKSTLVCGLTSSLRRDDEETMSPLDHAIRVTDEFISAFNAEDEEGWLDTHHFPHFRLAKGELKVTDRENHLVPFFFSVFKATTLFRWHHTAWDQREVVHVSEHKVHLATRLSRYEEDDSLIRTFDSLYIVTRQDGKWGIKGRSSFAPR
jgi:hypothetical protein